jgi:hypothetical protein
MRSTFRRVDLACVALDLADPAWLDLAWAGVVDVVTVGEDGVRPAEPAAERSGPADPDTRRTGVISLSASAAR